MSLVERLRHGEYEMNDEAADRIEMLEQIKANMCELHNVALARVAELEATAASYKQQVEAMAVEVEELQQKALDALIDADDAKNSCASLNKQLTAAQAEIERLSQENMRLKVDAERYRNKRSISLAEKKEWCKKGDYLFDEAEQIEMYDQDIDEEIAAMSAMSCKDLNEVKKEEAK